MLKRIIASLLAMSILAATAGILAEPVEEPVEEPVTYTVEELGYDRDTLTVATVTPLTGAFFTDMWGKGTSDEDVKNLLHNYPLTKFDAAYNNYQLNDVVVSGFQMTEDRKGNREYNIVLNEDLYYSDGSKITAWDYAFTILMMLHPETAKTGASLPEMNYIIGASAYASGKADVLSGLRVLSDYQLLIGVRYDALPFYYELSYLAFNPYPISEIAPGTKVCDDGKGAYIANDGADYTAELLNTTVLNEQSGYQTFPRVVSGPYTLVSFDGTTAEFEKNPYFKGDKDGNKARFKRIVFTSVSNEQAAEKLESSEVALVNKAMNTTAVASCMNLTADGLYSMSAYPRTGLSYISFCCEQPEVSEPEVRQAIAMCLDKASLVSATVGNYGLVLDGYWGLGQWVYRVIIGSEDYPTEDPVKLDQWMKLSLDDVKVYEFNTQEAAELLEKNGWKMTEDGVRAKKIGKETVRLELELIMPEGNNAAEFLQNEFTAALAEAGIALTVKVLPWTEMLNLYYRAQERSNEMFYLASNFGTLFDPAKWFDPSEEAQGVANKTSCDDEKLYTLASRMVKNEPGDFLGYATDWLSFVKRMAEVMPVIPVYSNFYFDFYTSALSGYNTEEYVSWTDAVFTASFQDVSEQVEEEDTIAPEDDEEIFE